MKKLILTTLTLAFVLLGINAVPARRGQWKLLNTTDGKVVKAELIGDENMHFWQTADGVRYSESDEKGLYQLADIDKMLASVKKVRQKMMLQNQKFGVKQAVTKGERKGIVILVDYPDKNLLGSKKFAFQKGENANEFYNWLFNTNHLKADGYVGSVFDYFYDQSDEAFKLTFDVVGPYTLSHNREYYGANTEDRTGNPKDGPGAKKMIVEACDLADADGVDFSKYDWEGDDLISQVYVIYAGTGEAFDLNQPEAVWPQSGNIISEGTEKREDPFVDDEGVAHNVMYDGKRLLKFACSSEIEIHSSGENILGCIGTICHEFSHCLGLMDHYDLKDQLYGTGRWDIMNQGSHNGDGRIPAGYSSFEKKYCGWLDPIEVKSNLSIKELRAYSEGGSAYLLRNRGYYDEYYLVENRQQTGWDKGLPGKGVIITHVDFDQTIYNYNCINTNNINSDDEVKNNHERIRIIPADGVPSYQTEANDPFDGGKELSQNSIPPNVVYNANSDGSLKLKWAIKNINVDSNGLASFDIVDEMEHEDNSPKLEIVSLQIDNSSISDQTFSGTTLTGHLELQNNDSKTNRDHVYVFVVEEGDTQKLNPDMDNIYCDLFVHPHKTQNIFFEFNQLQVGHRYAVAVTDFEINEFYRSDYFTCLPDASETLAIGSFFKAKTEEGLELTYRVYRNNPKLVEIRSESGELWENAATDKNFTGHLSIPSTVNGYTVARLGNFALYDMQGITSVSIPSTVKQLGSYAFCDCYSLSRIDGMEAVESIGDVAFKQCNKMKTIPLPHTLKTIGKQMISDNAELEYQVIPSSVISIRDESLLLNCPKLRSVVVERGNTVYDSRGGCNAIIKTATNEVVAGCAATTIPFGVTKITNLNWVDNLERIELPPTVTEIDDYAFWCTNELRTVLSHIKDPMPILDGKTFYASNRDINKLMTLYVPKGSLAKYRATEGWKSIVDIREMSERTEILRYFYNGWTYTLNKQAAGSGSRNVNKAEGGSGDVRTDADGWEMYRSVLTLDVTDDKGNTNTYTVDDGGVFLDLSEYGTMQKPTLLVDNASNKIWIFTNSKSEGENYEMDGFMYSANLNELVFEKETVFENEDQGWYANLEQGDNGEPQLTHYDMSEYVEVTSQRQEDATYVSEASTEITSPAEAEENWNETTKEPVPGDVNNDGVIDHTDMMALINAMAQKNCDASTDVNKDSRVNIADVMSIARMIAVNQYLEKVEAVDLGLPSGTLWASCNLGATTPEEFGNLYAWGEIEPKEEFTKDNYAFYNMSTNTYTDVSESGDMSGLAEYDAATAMMGAPWRMPTYLEFYELKNNCQTEWTTVNGVRGLRVIGTNGNSIFLPATAYDNEYGFYWSSRQYTGDNNPWAMSLVFDVTKQSVSWAYGYFRYLGFNIRPVKDNK